MKALLARPSAAEPAVDEGEPGSSRGSGGGGGLGESGAAAGDASAPGQRSAHLRPTGLPLELVPERRPAELAVGEELKARLLWRGEPLAGAQVRALAHAAPDDSRTTRTDAEGWASFRLDRAGPWRLAAVHMERVEEPEVPGEGAGGRSLPRADWRSTWTSLTFEVPELPKPGGREW